MTATDLKTGNLEKILGGFDIPIELKVKITNEISYYDEYYLTNSGKPVKVFQQLFIKDSYMDLPYIPKVRLISYSDDVDIEDLQTIFNKGEAPIITRAKESVVDLLSSFGFKEIRNKRGGILLS